MSCCDRYFFQPFWLSEKVNGMHRHLHNSWVLYHCLKNWAQDLMLADQRKLAYIFFFNLGDPFCIHLNSSNKRVHRDRQTYKQKDECLNYTFKKTTYALKTPSVVYVQSYSSVAFLVAALIISRFIHYWQPKKTFFLTWWPWLLIYDLDLQTWSRYPSTWPTCKNSDLYVCMFDK